MTTPTLLCTRCGEPRRHCICNGPDSSGPVDGVVGPRHCALCGEWPARETKHGLRCHLCECRDICAEHPVPPPGGQHIGRVENTSQGVYVRVPRWWAGRIASVMLLSDGANAGGERLGGQEKNHE